MCASDLGRPTPVPTSETATAQAGRHGLAPSDETIIMETDCQDFHQDVPQPRGALADGLGITLRRSSNREALLNSPMTEFPPPTMKMEIPHRYCHQTSHFHTWATSWPKSCGRSH